MKRILLIAVVLLAHVCYLEAAASPKIKIITPQSLVTKFEKDDGIPFVVASYGRIPYGANFIGGLALTDPLDGCSFIKHFSSGELDFDQSTIAIMKKGSCHNTIMTRNAQNAGAKLAIIIHTDNKLPAKVLGDATDAETITIPTIVISSSDGDKLIEFIKKIPYPPLNPDDIAPIASISFPYDEISGSVALDFWYSAADVQSVAYSFLNEIKQIATDEPNAFKFTPHFVTWDCYECRFDDYQTEVAGDCISGGRYCAPDPDEEGPLTGSDVLFEDLRQACLWESNPSLYWTYVAFYPNRCFEENINKTECSEFLLKESTDFITKKKAQDCIDQSFIKSSRELNTHLDDNRIFQKDKNLQLEYGITEFPVLLINHRPFSGDISDFNSVMQKICEKVNPKPASCIERGFADSRSPKLRYGLVIGFVLLLSIAATLLFSFYRKVAKRDMSVELSTEASHMVSRYMSVRDIVDNDKDEV